MNDNDLDSLRLLTHQQHEQRLREAGAERLARRRRRTPQGGLRLPVRIKLIYSVIASLDGYIEDAAGKFDRSC
jgi:hypothetical protein